MVNSQIQSTPIIFSPILIQLEVLIQIELIQNAVAQEPQGESLVEWVLSHT